MRRGYQDEEGGVRQIELFLAAAFRPRSIAGQSQEHLALHR